MKKNIDFSKLFLPVLIFDAIIAILGVIMLMLFSGRTFAEYTMNNLRSGLFVRALFCAVFVFVFTTVYFLLRFKNRGLKIGLISIIATILNSLTAFAFCVVCRANLGGLTFIVILISVLFTYITVTVFGNKLTRTVRKGSKNSSKDTLSEVFGSLFGSMLSVLIMTTLIVAIVLIITLIFGVTVLPLYVLPTLLSAYSAVFTTIVFVCKFFEN